MPEVCCLSGKRGENKEMRFRNHLLYSCHYLSEENRIKVYREKKCLQKKILSHPLFVRMQFIYSVLLR